MSTENNNFTIILITLNVVSLLVIFWLIYFIFNNFSANPYQSRHARPAYESLADNEPVRRESIRKPHVSGRPAQVKDVESRISRAIEKFKSSIEQDVFADITATDNLTENRVSQLQKARFDIEQSIKALHKLAREDVEYLQQYKEMKSRAGEQSVATISPQQAKQAQAKDAKSAKQSDNFNKVDVRRSYTDNAIRQSQQLAQRIRALLAEQEKGQDHAEQISSLEKTYIASLKPAAGERRNEVRTIRVRRGDTLWKIAQRAYGTGFAYPRIFKANPHLNNPDDITTGEILRVPR